MLQPRYIFQTGFYFVFCVYTPRNANEAPTITQHSKQCNNPEGLHYILKICYFVKDFKWIYIKPLFKASIIAKTNKMVGGRVIIEKNISRMIII